MSGPLRRHLHWLTLLLGSLLLALTWNNLPVAAAAFVVDSTADTADALPGDGLCADSGGACTLRAAIQEANANPGSDTISFAIIGGNTRINLATPLPVISDTVTIDGTTQPNSSCPSAITAANLNIELNGSNAGSNANGLTLAPGSDNSLVKGLVINQFAGNGILLQSDGNTITCSHIGTNRAGTAAAPNGDAGVNVESGADNVIGGALTSNRNVIAGNLGSGVFAGPPATEPIVTTPEDDPILPPPSGTMILGNYIGTNALGTTALANGVNGVTVTGLDNTDSVISNCLVSGNSGAGIAVLEGATFTLIEGNKIGTNILGNWNLPNGANGVLIENGAQTVIHDNLISGNIGAGVFIADPPSSIAAENNVITANYIGTNVTGATALANVGPGVSIQNASLNTVGGSNPTERNIISGNAGDGVYIMRSPGFTAVANQVLGNYIGIAVNGEVALGNDGVGVNIFGGVETLVQANWIGGNAAGVSLSGNTTTDNIVIGNAIGTDPTGTFAWGNGEHGVFLNSRATGNQIGGIAPGEGNIIALHSGRGIWMTAVGTENNSIRGNSIYDNQGDEIENKLGIDLAGSGVNPNDPLDADVGPNLLQNYPDLINLYSFDGAFLLNAVLNSAPNTTFDIDFYLNSACDPSGYGEGEIYHQSVSVSTNADGVAVLTMALDPVDPGTPFLTSTATDPAGNTSEFSNCVAVTEALVVNTADDNDDGTCNQAHCSLREAINAANNMAGEQSIVFAINGAGPHTIMPLSALPVISDTVTIDGLSQPGAQCLVSLTSPPVPTRAAAPSLMIAIDGNLAGTGVDGLTLTGTGNTVMGLSITNFAGHGLVLTGGGDSRVACNALGVAPDGQLPGGNNGHGLVIDDSPGNLIGEMPAPPPESDPVPTEPISFGNVIGANGQSGVLIMGAAAAENALYGNVIGVNRDGTSMLGNVAAGVTVDGAPNLRLGSTADLLLNVIAGNGGHGVSLANVSSGWVEGNFIGVDSLGTTALPNGQDGVALASSSGLTLNRNLISGNNGRGVSIDAASSQNSLTGNVIGSDVWGLSLLGNGSDGVAIFGSENEIVGGQILYNEAAGLLIEGSSAVSNSVSSTAFFGNLALGIDLAGDGVTPNDPLDADAGPNQLQNSPVISDVVITLVDTTISGYLESAADETYTVELYGSPFCDGSGYGEGYWPLDTVMVTTDGSGYGAFEIVLAEPLAAGTFVSGLATDAAGNSSEFGACLPEPGDFAAVLVSPANPAQTVGSGLTAVYEMQLINLGNVADTYTLTVSGDWDAALSVMVTPELQPGETFTFTVTVTVPAGTPISTSDETLISAISAYDNNVVGFSIATTTVGWLRLLLPIIIH